MGKLRILRLDVFFWVVLLITGAGWYLSGNPTGWMVSFLLSAVFYLTLTFWIRTIGLQRNKENQRITHLSELRAKPKGHLYLAASERHHHPLQSFGKSNGQWQRNRKAFFSFMIRLGGDDNSRWRTLIKDIVIPENHLESFGRYTELMVLYNPENKCHFQK
jgi:hypothetical protein